MCCLWSCLEKSHRVSKPVKCPKCTSIRWDDNINRKFNVLIARSNGPDPETKVSQFCIMDKVDSPLIITEDTFSISGDIIRNYFNHAHYPIGSAIVFIGDLELNSDRELVVNDMNLIYIHEVGFRSYSGVYCVYNACDLYARQELIKPMKRIRRKFRKQGRIRKVDIEEKREELRQEQMAGHETAVAEIEGENA